MQFLKVKCIVSQTWALHTINPHSISKDTFPFEVHKSKICTQPDSPHKRCDLAMDSCFTVKKLLDEHSVDMSLHIKCDMVPNKYRLTYSHWTRSDRIWFLHITQPTPGIQSLVNSFWKSSKAQNKTLFYIFWNGQNLRSHEKQKRIELNMLLHIISSENYSHGNSDSYF